MTDILKCTTDNFKYTKPGTDRYGRDYEGSLFADRSDLPKANFRGSPDVVEVTSTHTGRTVTYRYDDETMMENECFDGELTVYVTDEDVPAKRVSITPY